MEEKSMPFKCPVCDGTGLVSKPPYFGDGVDGNTSHYPCKSCSGAGIVWNIHRKQFEEVSRHKEPVRNDYDDIETFEIDSGIWWVSYAKWLAQQLSQSQERLDSLRLLVQKYIEGKREEEMNDGRTWKKEIFYNLINIEKNLLSKCIELFGGE
jgi:hypothetical protein